MASVQKCKTNDNLLIVCSCHLSVHCPVKTSNISKYKRVHILLDLYFAPFLSKYHLNDTLQNMIRTQTSSFIFDRETDVKKIPPESFVAEFTEYRDSEPLPSTHISLSFRFRIVPICYHWVVRISAGLRRLLIVSWLA